MRAETTTARTFISISILPETLFHRNCHHSLLPISKSTSVLDTSKLAFSNLFSSLNMDFIKDDNGYKDLGVIIFQIPSHDNGNSRKEGDGDKCTAFTDYSAATSTQPALSLFPTSHTSLPLAPTQSTRFDRQQYQTQHAQQQASSHKLHHGPHILQQVTDRSETKVDRADISPYYNSGGRAVE
jgi:hypothetical protein